MESTKKQSAGFAVTALVLGIIAFIFGWTGIPGLVLAILAIVFGILALVKKQSKGMGITGIVLGGIALITASIVTIAGLAFIGGAAHVANEVDQAKQQVKDAKKDFAKGETAMFGNLQVKATTVTSNYQATDGFSKPDDGKQFVFVELTIKNTGNETVSINPFDFKLDDAGVVADHSLVTTPAPLDAVDLKAGATLTGDMVFQAASTSSNFKLQYMTYDSKALENVTYTLAL